MTANAEILAKADAVAALVAAKLYDELTAPVDIPQVQLPSGAPGSVPVIPVIQDLEGMRALAQGIADTIRPEFAWFTEPDLDAVAGMLNSLSHIVGLFENPLQDPALGYLEDLESYVVDWYGSAADAFRLNFLNPFPSIRHNQVALVGELATILEGYQTMLLESRRKILEVGDQMIAALTALPSGGTPLPVMISILTAVVGVLAAAYSGGGSLVIPLAVLGGGLGVATEIADAGVIQGGNVQGVINSMNDTLRLIKLDIAAAEDLLMAALAHDLNLLGEAEIAAASRTVNHFIPLRPNVIDVMNNVDVDFEYSNNG
jgi:hypothetical protein